MKNGCVCCSVKSDFLAAIEELVRRKRFDYIFVECSGIADPGQLARMFWVDEAVRRDACACTLPWLSLFHHFFMG